MNTNNNLNIFVGLDLNQIDYSLKEREVSLGLRISNINSQKKSISHRIQGIWKNFCVFIARVLEFFHSGTWKSENQAISKLNRDIVKLTNFLKERKIDLSKNENVVSRIQELKALLERIEAIRNKRLQLECQQGKTVKVMEDYPDLQRDYKSLESLVPVKPPSKPSKSVDDSHKPKGPDPKPLVSKKIPSDDELRRMWKDLTKNGTDLDSSVLTQLKNLLENSNEPIEKVLKDYIARNSSVLDEAIRSFKAIQNGARFYIEKVRHAYKREEVKGDGDCFIHALVNQLGLSDTMDNVLKVRNELADHLVANKTVTCINRMTLEDNIVGQSDGLTFDDYIKSLRQSATQQGPKEGWVGIELAYVIMSLYKRPVHIFHPEDKAFGEKKFEGRPLPSDAGYTFENLSHLSGWNPEPLRFLHNGWDHWDYLVKK